MQTILPAIPYPPMPQPGYWYPVTSTINWCEEDYYATPWVAELINTFTNLLFVLLALKGSLNCLRQHHERIFLVTFIGYATVGTGSMLFHASLKYPMQLVDELSMIYTTCIMCFSSFSFRKPDWYKWCVGVGLIALAAFITGYYHFLQDPVFHQRMYALLTVTVLSRSMIVMEMTLRPRMARDKERRAALMADQMAKDGEVKPEVLAEWKRQDARDRRIVKTMWTMVAFGLGIFLLGFLIWHLDNKHCYTLRRWRREIGLPWGFFLEGHGWWHLMTGVGAYFYIMWGIWLRHCLLGRHDMYELVWPSLFFSLPVVMLVEPENRAAEMQAAEKRGVEMNGEPKKSR